MAEMHETTRALSDLADVCLEAGLRVARAGVVALYGKPRFRGEDGRYRACEFAVIALGKHGGQELNFSSDIDLLFIYTSDEGGTAGIPGPGGSRQNRISNNEFHTRLAQRLIALMSENTEEGHVFRVDTRLRPEGGQGALAHSLPSCRVYCESWGETWERQTLIKARPAAGSVPLGSAFIDLVQPFIYRRTLDMSALDEIARIKQRINRNLTARGSGVSNVKLGEGGIREIEFIVQAFQLIYGGKESLLRNFNTLQALSRIESLGFLPMPDCRDLAAAYVFFRDVEHRVQVTHGLQTHEIPTGPRGLAVLSRKMGFRDAEEKGEIKAFQEALARHQTHVTRVFDNLFRNRGGEKTSSSPPSAGPSLPSAETYEDSLSPPELVPYNFADPAAASEQLRLLRNGEPFSHVSAKAKRQFDDLLPRLLFRTFDLPDPNQAVSHLLQFVGRAGGRDGVFSVMTQNKRVFDMLLHLFGSSGYLSEILIAQPDLFDTLLQPGALTESRSAETLEAALLAATRKRSGGGKRFAALCDAKRGEELAIGIRSILGEADILDTLGELTCLAEASVRVGLSLAEEAVRPIFGKPLEEKGGEEAGFAVIAMGKLGGGEMNFGSDLDLVFVYSSSGTTDGMWEEKPAARGPVSNHEYFVRLVTLFRDGLAAPEGGRRAYEIDLRLRPEGQKGALAAPLGIFARYFRGRAENWERQALCRARAVAGSETTQRAFMDLVRDFVYGEDLSPRFKTEIAHIRERLERELAREAEGRIDIKLGHGGIADIEFLVQYLQIIHGRGNPALRGPNTLAALEALRNAGNLSSAQASVLIEAYRFLRLAENRLRIATSHPIHTFPESPEGVEMLARRIGYQDDEAGSARAKLFADYERQTGNVRRIYEVILQEAVA